MNSENAPATQDPLSASERWIDAALVEHARLGRDGTDEELVLRILQGTVRRPARVTAVPRSALDRKTAVASLGAVAAVAALILGVLSLFSIPSEGRRSDELHFIVRVVGPMQADGITKAAPTAVITTHRGMDALKVIPPAVAPEGSPSLAQVDLIMNSEFTPTFEELPRRGDRFENLRITADRGSSSPEALVYEGDVLVEHTHFRIEAASVRVPITSEDSESEGARLQARQVRVVQSSTACIAEAETLRFDPVSGSLVLTGVSRVETAKGELDRFAPLDRLVLSGDGFTVERAPVEIHASSPLRVP